jgi:hypothetical protein
MSAVIPLPARRPPIGKRLDDHLQQLGCIPPEAARPLGFVARLLGRRRHTLVQAATAPRTVPPEIEALIARLPTGGWSIRAETAHALATLFSVSRPRRVLEFGSGSSTVLLAALCAHAGGGRRVVSLDERPAYMARTRKLLDDFDLGQHVTTLVAPVTDSIFGSWAGRTYRPDRDTLRLALAGERADFVFVDGPANWLGRRGDCRFGTLPLASAFVADEALFVADDALRPRDLAIVQRWRSLPYIEVRGILPVGRGLAVGILRGK